MVDDIFCRPGPDDLASFQQERMLAMLSDHAEVVGYKQDGPSTPSHVVHLTETLSLKIGIADSKHLVDNKNFRIKVRGDGEGQP
jgi:hypothetical protein